MTRHNKYEEFTDDAKQQIQDYINLKIELIRIDVQMATARTVSYLFSGILIAFFLFMVVLFISLVGGFYLSEKLHNYTYGFGIVGACYVIVFIVLLILRKSVVERKIADTVVSLIHRDHD
jgi:hypothetical protein